MSVAMLLGKDAAAAIKTQRASFIKSFDENLMESAGKHFDFHTGNTGSPLTEEALTSIRKDVADNIIPGEGAGMSNTGVGNMLTSAFNTKDGFLAPAMMGGGIGMLGALATDGEATEGAVIGSVVGAGIKGIGTGIARNIEKKFVGDLLGDRAGSFTVKEATEQIGDVAAQPAQSIRQQQLSAIKNLDDAALKDAGAGAKFKQDLLTGESKFNISQATRISGFAGTALTGMAFSSRRKDHRRGFNRNRGNRV